MRSKRRKQYGVGLWIVLQMVMPADCVVSRSLTTFMTCAAAAEREVSRTALH